MNNQQAQLARQIYDGWIGVNNAFHAKLQPRMAQSPISFSQYEVLFAIHNLGIDTVSVKDLSQFMLKTSSAITQAVASLEKQKLVKRVHATEDRRVVHVKPTQKGTSAFKQMDDVIVSSLGEAISSLTPDEISEYIRINTKIAKLSEK